MTALPKGQFVKHYRYGFGVVTESDAELTAIEFEFRGTKKFVTSLMVVDLSDFTPPEALRSKWVKSTLPPVPRKGARKASKVTAAAFRARIK
jgi:hypothetical protein